MDSATDDRALPRPGCPIRTSPDQSLLSSSPEHFAAGHVLHRLLAPRHPPLALPVLTKSRYSARPDSSGRTVACARRGRPWTRKDIRLSKTAGVRRANSRPARSRPARPRGAERIETHRRPGGADRDRTDDLRLAKPALSQLSYSPTPSRGRLRTHATPRPFPERDGGPG